MSGEKRIFWLASYPKSGNTWTRSFIAALRREPDDEEDVDIDLNNIRTGAIASGRDWIERGLGFTLDTLSADEIDRLRPTAYRFINSQLKQIGYHKAHDAFSFVGEGNLREPMFPKSATRGALYIVRNPLDVCISYANHSSCSIDESIARMRKPEGAFCKTVKGQANQVRQWLWTWSDHVRSWQQADFPVKLVRYEDMKADPHRVFQDIAKFLELPHSDEDIARANEVTRFERLQAKEKERGFKEKPPGVASFFRKGIAGDWVNTLSRSQVDEIVRDHYDVMKELGYLPTEEELSKVLS